MPASTRLLTALVLLTVLPRAAAEPQGLSNPFYAMDTAFRRPGLTTAQQLDLVKEQGYAGVAWTETSPVEAKAVADQASKRGLKMFTIYCGARVTTAGELNYSPRLKELMAALKGHGTLIWLHLPGSGPKVGALTGKEPVVGKLRELADDAARHGLRIAVYPHRGFWVADTGSAIKLARVVDRKNFGVTFNLIHSLWAGEEKEIPRLIQEAGPLLFSVTINGAEPTPRTGILTLDRGSYDTGIVLRAVRRVGYPGPIGFQGYGIKGHPRDILGPTMKAWRKLSAEAAGSR